MYLISSIVFAFVKSRFTDDVAILLFCISVLNYIYKGQYVYA